MLKILGQVVGGLFLAFMMVYLVAAVSMAFLIIPGLLVLTIIAGQIFKRINF